MDPKHFTYGKLYTVTKVLAFLLAVFCILVGLVSLWELISVVTGHDIKSSLTATQLFWNIIAYCIWSPFFYTFLAYLGTDVVVREDGLQIKFLFRNFLIPWSDIAEFRRAKVLGFRLLREAYIVVLKKGLTPLHRAYGLMYGSTRQPSLLIWSYIGHYDELVAAIKRNLKKRRPHTVNQSVQMASDGQETLG